MAQEGGGYLRGLVTGVLVGAATALLLTPKRGEDIRHDLVDSASRLREKAEDLSGQLSETAHELKERGAHLVENARERSSDFIAQSGDQGREWETNSDAGEEDSSHSDQESSKAQAHDVVDSV